MGRNVCATQFIIPATAKHSAVIIRSVLVIGQGLSVLFFVRIRMVFKQALFAFQTRLVWSAKKRCLHRKEGFFCSGVILCLAQLPQPS